QEDLPASQLGCAHVGNRTAAKAAAPCSAACSRRGLRSARPAGGTCAKATGAALRLPLLRLRCPSASGDLASRVRAAVGARALIRSSGERADRLLHFGGQRGEFLCAFPDLLTQLRAEFSLLLEQLRDGLRSKA